MYKKLNKIQWRLLPHVLRSDLEQNSMSFNENIFIGTLSTFLLFTDLM